MKRAKKQDVIVYSAISDGGTRIRFALRPVLDSAHWRPEKFPCRVVWDGETGAGRWHGGLGPSCRGRDFDETAKGIDWNQFADDDDGWLHWLLDGEQP